MESSSNMAHPYDTCSMHSYVEVCSREARWDAGEFRIASWVLQHVGAEDTSQTQA